MSGSKGPAIASASIVLDVETGELAFFSMSAEIAGVAGFCAGLPGPVRAAYEAGPTGYGLARAVEAAGGVHGGGAVEDSAWVG